VQNEHQSHEVRLSTNEKSRVRALVGAYWEKFVINDNMLFNYLGFLSAPRPTCDCRAGGEDCLSPSDRFRHLRSDLACAKT